jgi:hypothetical protein
MCVAGTCEATNTNPNANCAGVNVCSTALDCSPNQDDTGRCYSTNEGAGFCIQRGQAMCFDPSVRPQCSDSADCAAIPGHESSVCVLLKDNENSMVGCCSGVNPQATQFPGFCVPLADRWGA